MTNATIDLEDIQGYVIHGYKRMLFSRNLLLQVTDASLAKGWLHDICDSVTIGIHHPTADPSIETCLNIAFTSEGLKAIGLNEGNLQNFTREFREGMTTPHRQRLLGDTFSSAPDNWQWGGPKNEAVHILLILFAADNAKLLAYANKIEQGYSTRGLKKVIILDGQQLEANREHFGFRDGIGQPVIAGSGRSGPKDDIIATGEFIMGYKNEYDVFPDTPLIESPQGNTNLLQADAGGSGKKDLGRNGSYLVFRQIQQNVEAFWTFMNEKTKNPEGEINVEESTRLAAKMIGRWPSGAPLVKYPHKDPGVLSDDDDFNFAVIDKYGNNCPFGSHIRRANPRDSFEDDDPKESLRLTKRHRILRRSKLYGTPHWGSPVNVKPEGEVGLLFMCFNADISRQYEFVQYTWAGYPKFKELYNDPDPIIGTKEFIKDGEEQNFTIQQDPVSKCITGLQRFIQVKGGAYFFFPSLTSIRFLSTV